MGEDWWLVREIKSKAVLAVQTEAPSFGATQAMWRPKVSPQQRVNGASKLYTLRVCFDVVEIVEAGKVQV